MLLTAEQKAVLHVAVAVAAVRAVEEADERYRVKVEELVNL